MSVLATVRFNVPPTPTPLERKPRRCHITSKGMVVHHSLSSIISLQPNCAFAVCCRSQLGQMTAMTHGKDIGPVLVAMTPCSTALFDGRFATQSMLKRSFNVTAPESVDHPLPRYYREHPSAMINQAFPFVFSGLACWSFCVSHSLAFLKVVLVSLLTIALSAAWMPALICIR